MIDAHVARLNGPHEVEFGVETLSTNPGPDEIVAETLKSAISVGTEIAAFEGIAPLRPGPIYPRVVGYCNVARVIATGPDVETVASGDIVVTTQSHRSAFRCAESAVIGRVPAGVTPGDACEFLLHTIAGGRLPARQMLSGESQWTDLATVYERLSARTSGELSHLLNWRE